MDLIDAAGARLATLDVVQAEFFARFTARAAKAAALDMGGQSATSGGTGQNATAQLSKEEQAQVEQLKARDREVRDHEQAHARVGGQYAGEPTYSYQTGPDGRQYAVGGEVAIDVAPVAGDPEATIAKMEVVKAAALAPARPSSADRQVAATADAQKFQALGELNAQRREKFAEGTGALFALPESPTQSVDVKA